MKEAGLVGAGPARERGEAPANNEPTRTEMAEWTLFEVFVRSKHGLNHKPAATRV